MASVFTPTKIEIILDDEDYIKAKDYKWTINHNVPKTLVDRKRVSIVQVIFGVDQDYKTIHKNNNIYDFRRDNISFCDKHTYRYLCLAGVRNTHSKYYGVAKAKKSWAAKVYNSGTKQRYETYHSEWEAAVAADYHAVLKYKDYALRNFPEMSFEELKDIRDKAYSDILNNKAEYRSQRSQGSRNFKKKHSYVGVTVATKFSWDACIRKLGERIYIGRFYSEEDAAIAYDFRALELYGENAKRNFPEISPEKLKVLYQEILDKKEIFTEDYESRCIQGRKTKIRKVTSDYLGVSYYKRDNKWQATITFRYKSYYLGRYKTEIEAAKAYDIKALELYGEEAKLNFKD